MNCETKKCILESALDDKELTQEELDSSLNNVFNYLQELKKGGGTY